MRSITWPITLLALTSALSQSAAALIPSHEKSSRWLVWDSGTSPHSPDPQDLTLDTERACEFRRRAETQMLTANNVFRGAPVENAPGLAANSILPQYDRKFYNIIQNLNLLTTVDLFESFAPPEINSATLVILLPEHHLSFADLTTQQQALHDQRNQLLLEMARAAVEQNIALINLAEGPEDINWRSLSHQQPNNSFFVLAKSGIRNIAESSRFIENPILFNSVQNSMTGQELLGLCGARDSDMATQIIAAAGNSSGVAKSIIFATFGLAHYPGISNILRNSAIPFLTIIPKQPRARRSSPPNS